jgi:glucose/arabinose dehydrogenase
MVILGASLATVAGCSAGPASSASSPSVAASPTATLAPTPTALPSLPADAAPADLKGRWTTLMGPGDEVLLIIGDSGYSIRFSGVTNNGHISVVGDQIAFSRVNSCAGTGTYRWAIGANAILTFTPFGDPDPCPRGGVLKGQAYARE